MTLWDDIHAYEKMYARARSEGDVRHMYHVGRILDRLYAWAERENEAS